MTRKQSKHLREIEKAFLKSVRAKYRKGAKEHGGFLGDNPNLLDEALNEVVDLYTYLYTLKQVKDEDDRCLGIQ